MTPGSLRAAHPTESGSEDISDITAGRGFRKCKSSAQNNSPQVTAAISTRHPLGGANTLLDVPGPFRVM